MERLKKMEVGDSIDFSGPWGKFLKEDIYAKNGDVLIVRNRYG